MKDLYSFLDQTSNQSDFKANLSNRGGFITFSNSGRRGGVKYFQIGLDNLLQTLKDILANLDVFADLTDYVEKSWRDNGSAYFTDPVANANSTVQTKPLFSTLSKIIIWANQPDLDSIDPDNQIILTKDSLSKAIEKLEAIAETFRPKSQKRTNRQNTISNQISDSSYLPYLTALRTKPFMLLAGISGTGKSRLVKELAFMTCPNKAEFNQDKTTPGNYCLVEVKPNWHDSSELLGYYNALDGKYELTPFIRFAYRALQNDNVPFFVCLDEMNLAPVEQYFAEYLSVLETRTLDETEIISSELIKKETFNGIDIENKYEEEDKQIATYIQKNGLKLPSNLYVIGTVNMDDTTHQFSRKVIDRAFTIEMNGGNLTEMFSSKNAAALKYRDKEMSLNIVKSLFVQANEIFEWSDADGNHHFARYEDTIKTAIPSKLQAINGILADTPFQVSYRVQNELILYLAYLIQQAGFPDDIEPLVSEAVLAILLEKILPRVQGDDKLLGRENGKDVFTELKEHIEKTYVQKEQPQDGEGQVKEVVKGSTLYTQVLNKLEQMHKRLENSYFANFF